MRYLFSFLVFFVTVIGVCQVGEAPVINGMSDRDESEFTIAKVTQLLAEGDTVAATQMVEMMHSNNPKDLQVLEQKIEFLLMAQKYAEANALIDKSLKIGVIPNFYSQKARCLYDSKEYDAALKYIDKAIRLEDNDYFHYVKGYILYIADRYDDALPYLMRAISTDSVTYSDCFYYIGYIYQNDKSDATNAILYYDTYLKFNPLTEAAIVAKADIKFTIEDYKGSMEDYALLTSIDPENSVYCFGLGRAQLFLKEYEQSSVNLTKAIALDSITNSVTLLHYYNLGLARLGLGDTLVSDGIFNRMFDQYPQSSDSTYLLRGHYYYERNNYTKALDDYLRSRIIKNTASVNFSIANSYYCIEDYEQAEIYYTYAIAIDPSVHEYYYYRAKSKQYLKKYKSAQADIDQAIVLISGNSDYHLTRAYNYSRLNKYKEAIVDYDLAVDLSPNDASFCFFRSKFRSYDLKDGDGAIRDVKMAIKLDSMNSEYFCYYANYVITFKNDSLKGKQLMEKAIAVDPTYITAYIDIISLCLDQKDFSDAERWVNVYLNLPQDDEWIYYTVSQLYVKRKLYVNSIMYQTKFIERLSENQNIQKLNLAELYLFNQQYDKILEICTELELIKAELDDYEAVVTQYLKCVALAALNKELKPDLVYLVEKVNSYNANDGRWWNFADYDVWIKEAPLTADQKISIEAITNHVKPKLLID